MNTAPPTIGIIGGFGPDTSAAFCARLVHHAHALKPSHPPAFVADFVSVPPAIAGQAINGSREAGALLAHAISGSIARLQHMGVQTVALPCNTMHLFADAFVVPPPLKLFHIVDAVIEELVRQGITRVGLLATELTVASGLYADRCRARGIECIAPSTALQRRLCDSIAQFVESGDIAPGTSTCLSAAFDELHAKGTEAIVLGCTDIGGMLERCGLKAEIPCIDSMDILAKACARLSV